MQDTNIDYARLALGGTRGTNDVAINRIKNSSYQESTTSKPVVISWQYRHQDQRASFYRSNGILTEPPRDLGHTFGSLIVKLEGYNCAIFINRGSKEVKSCGMTILEEDQGKKFSEIRLFGTEDTKERDEKNDVLSTIIDIDLYTAEKLLGKDKRSHKGLITASRNLIISEIDKRKIEKLEVIPRELWIKLEKKIHEKVNTDKKHKRSNCSQAHADTMIKIGKLIELSKIKYNEHAF